MRNPWLNIPLADYEGHMSLPTVGQSRLIADQLDALVKTYSPRSVAIIGCAGGNGFEHLVGTSVTRVVGVDINPDYIEQARRRFEGRISGLELLVADIQAPGLLFEPVDLIYVALVLEYVDMTQAIGALHRHCGPNGILAVLSQLPHETLAHVSPSPYTSLTLLAPGMRLVAQEELTLHARQAGFSTEHSTIVMSGGGKRFSVDTFRLRLGVPAPATLTR